MKRVEAGPNRRKLRRHKPKDLQKSKMKEELRKRMRRRSESEGSQDPPRPTALKKQQAKATKEGGDFSKKMGKLYRKKKRKLDRRKRMGGDSSSQYEKESSRSRPRRIKRGRRLGSEMSQERSESDMTWASGMYRTMDREMMAEWDRKQARKSPLTNKAPGSEYQRLLRRKKKIRERKEKQRESGTLVTESIDMTVTESGAPISFVSDVSAVKLTESLDVNAYRVQTQETPQPRQSALDQISERERKVEGSSKFPSKRDTHAELKRTLKELELKGDLRKEMVAFLEPDFQSSKRGMEGYEEVYKSHNVRNTRDVRVKAVVKTGKRMKQYQMKKGKDGESGTRNHSVDGDDKGHRNFAQIYKRKKKKVKKGVRDKEEGFEKKEEEKKNVESKEIKYFGENEIANEEIQNEDIGAKLKSKKIISQELVTENNFGPEEIEKQEEKTPELEIAGPSEAKEEIKTTEKIDPLKTNLKNQNEQFELPHAEKSEIAESPKPQIKQDSQTTQKNEQPKKTAEEINQKIVEPEPPQNNQNQIKKPENETEKIKKPAQRQKSAVNLLETDSKPDPISTPSKPPKVTETVRKRTRKTIHKPKKNFIELNKSKTKLAQQALRLQRESEERMQQDLLLQQQREKELQERRRRNQKRREKKDFIKQNLKIKKRRSKRAQVLKNESESQRISELGTSQGHLSGYDTEKKGESSKLGSEILGEENYHSSPRLGDIGRAMYESKGRERRVSGMSKKEKERNVSVEKINEVLKGVFKKEERVRENLERLAIEEEDQGKEQFDEVRVESGTKIEELIIKDQEIKEIPFTVLRLEELDEQEKRIPETPHSEPLKIEKESQNPAEKKPQKSKKQIKPEPKSDQIKNIERQDESKNPSKMAPQTPKTRQNQLIPQKATKSQQETPRMTKTHSLNWQNFYDGTMRLGPENLQRKSSAKLLLRGKVEIDQEKLAKFKKEKEKNKKREKEKMVKIEKEKKAEKERKGKLKVTKERRDAKKKEVRAKIDTGLRRSKMKSRKNSLAGFVSGGNTPKSKKRVAREKKEINKSSGRTKKSEVKSKVSISKKQEKSEKIEIKKFKSSQRKKIESSENITAKNKINEIKKSSEIQPKEEQILIPKKSPENILDSLMSANRPSKKEAKTSLTPKTSKPRVVIKKNKIKKDSARKHDSQPRDSSRKLKQIFDQNLQSASRNLEKKKQKNFDLGLALSQQTPRGRSETGDVGGLRLADLSPSKIERSIREKVEGRGIKVSSARRYTDRKGKGKEWRLEIADILRTDRDGEIEEGREKNEKIKNERKKDESGEKEIKKPKNKRREKQDKPKEKVEFGDLRKRSRLLSERAEKPDSNPNQEQTQVKPKQTQNSKATSNPPDRVFNKKKHPSSQNIQPNPKNSNEPEIVKMYEQRYQIRKSENVAKSINTQIKRTNRKKFQKTQSLKGLVESLMLETDPVDESNYQSVQVRGEDGNDFKRLMREKRSEKVIRVDHRQSQVKVNNIDRSKITGSATQKSGVNVSQLESGVFLKKSAQISSFTGGANRSKLSGVSETDRGRKARHSEIDKKEAIKAKAESEKEKNEKDQRKVNFLEKNKVAIAKGAFKKKIQKRDPMYLPPIKKRAAQSVAVNHSLQWARGRRPNQPLDSNKKRRGGSLERKRKQKFKNSTISNRTSVREIAQLKGSIRQINQNSNKNRIKRLIKEREGKGISHLESIIDGDEKTKKAKSEQKKLEAEKKEAQKKIEEKEKSRREFENLKTQFEQKIFENKKKKGSRRNMKTKDDFAVKREIRRSRISARSGSVAIKRASKPVKINFIERNKMLARKRAEEMRKKREEKEKREKQKEERKKLFASQVLEEIRRESLERKQRREGAGEGEEEEEQKKINNGLVESKVEGLFESEIVEKSEDAVKIENGEESDEVLAEIEEKKQESEENEGSVAKEKSDNKNESSIKSGDETEKKEDDQTNSQTKNKIPEQNQNKKENPFPATKNQSQKDLEREQKREEIRSRMLRRGKTGHSASVSNNSQIERSQTKDRELGWNSSKRTEDLKFKERKKYVNPKALRPKKKAPTKELDMAEIIKKNEMKERKKTEREKIAEKTGSGVLDEGEEKILESKEKEDGGENSDSVISENPELIRDSKIEKKLENKEEKRVETEIKSDKIIKIEKKEKPENAKIDKIKEEPTTKIEIKKPQKREPSEIIESNVIAKQRESEMKRQEIKKMLISEEQTPERRKLITEEEIMRIQELDEWIWTESIQKSETENEISEKISENKEKFENKKESENLEENLENEKNISEKNENTETAKSQTGKSEKNLGIIEEMKLMRQKIEENRGELRKKILENSSELLKVKNIEKFRKKGKEKREKGNERNNLGYPVYKKSEAKKRRERELEIKRLQEEERLRIEKEEKNKIKVQKFGQKGGARDLEKEIKEKNRPAQSEIAEETESEMGTADLREKLRDIIKKENSAEGERQQDPRSEKEISIEGDISIKSKNSRSEESEQSIGKTQEILQILDDTPKSAKEEEADSKSKSLSKQDKKPTAPAIGGYYSRYQSKKAKMPHSVVRKEKTEKNKRKVARFSSRQIKKRGYYALGLGSKKREKTRSNGGGEEKEGNKEEERYDNEAGIGNLGFRGRQMVKPGEIIGKDANMDEMEIEKSEERDRRETAEIEESVGSDRERDLGERRGRGGGSVSSDDSEGVVKRRKRRNSLQKRVLGQRKRQFSLQPQISARSDLGKRKLLRPLVKKELMKSNLRESTPATQAKMRQSILENLEKLKKITPILKKAQADKERQEKAESVIRKMKARMSVVGEVRRRGIGSDGSYDSQKSNDDFEEIEKELMAGMGNKEQFAKATVKKSQMNKKPEKKIMMMIREKPKTNSQVGLIKDSKKKNFSSKKTRPPKKTTVTRKKAKTRVERKRKKNLVRRGSLKEEKKMLVQAEQAALDLTANILRLREEMEISEFKPGKNEIEEAQTKEKKAKTAAKSKKRKKRKVVRGRIRSEMNNKIPANLNENDKKPKRADAVEVRKRTRKRKKRVKRSEKAEAESKRESGMSKTMELDERFTEKMKEDGVEFKEKTDSQIEKGRMSLQWRKERIAGYGRVKSKSKAIDRKKSKKAIIKVSIKKEQKTEKKEEIQSNPKKPESQNPIDQKVKNIVTEEPLKRQKRVSKDEELRPNSPADLRKRDIKKINSRFWKDQQTEEISSPLQKNKISESCMPDLQSPSNSINQIKQKQKDLIRRLNSRSKNQKTSKPQTPKQDKPERPSVDWPADRALTESNASSGHNEISKTQNNDFQRESAKPRLTIGTGGQAVSQQRVGSKNIDQEDQHFQNLIARNANFKSNVSMGKSEIDSSGVKVRSRLRTLKKTDSKKERDLNRLKKFKERLRKEGNMGILSSVNLKPRGVFKGMEDVMPRSSLQRNHFAEREALRESSPVDLIIENRVSGVQIEEEREVRYDRNRTNHRHRNLGSGEWKVEHQTWEGVAKSPEITRGFLDKELSDRMTTGLSSDLMVKNKVIIEDESGGGRIGTIPEFEDVEMSGERAKKRYRRDRVRELGKKLKKISSRKSRGSLEMDDLLD